MGNLYSHLPVVNVNQYEEVGDADDDTVMARTPVPAEPSGNSKSLFALIDPRSPTVGVSRTPVEIVAERQRKKKMQMLQALDNIQNVTKGMDTLNVKTAEEKCPVTPIDPRSPTFEYKRTPLAMEEIRFKTVGPSSVDSDVNEFNDENQTPERKVYDTELQAPVSASAHMCRDLRKRLFVEKVIGGVTEIDETENKEN